MLSKKELAMKLEIGTKITWVSAAGRLNGTITLSPSAAGTVTPWIDIKTDRTTVRLCASDGYLKQMKVELYKDNMVERTNLMTGKTYMEDKDTPRCCSPSSELFWTM
jgi:hypothetical protein